MGGTSAQKLAWSRKMIALGRCPRCSKPHDTGGRHCERCARRVAEYQKMRRQFSGSLPAARCRAALAILQGIPPDEEDRDFMHRLLKLAIRQLSEGTILFSRPLVVESEP